MPSPPSPYPPPPPPILHFESLSLASSPPDSLSPASTPSDDDHHHHSFVSPFDSFPAHSPPTLPVIANSAPPSKPGGNPLQGFETEVRDVATAFLQTSKRRPSRRTSARRGAEHPAACANKSERRSSDTNANAELLASWKAAEPLCDRSNVRRCGGGGGGGNGVVEGNSSVAAGRGCTNSAASGADENCDSASVKKSLHSAFQPEEAAECKRGGAEEGARGRRGKEIEEAAADDGGGGGAKSPLGPAGSTGRQQKNMEGIMRERLIERRRRRRSATSVRESLLAEAWERKREQQHMKFLLQQQKQQQQSEEQAEEEDPQISPSDLHFRSPAAALPATETSKEAGTISSSLIEFDSTSADRDSNSAASAAAATHNARRIQRTSPSFRNHHPPNNNNNFPKSLTDEDFAELRGCIDLGFRFDQSSVPELSDTLPALQVVCAVAQNLPTDYCLSPVRSPAARCSSPSSPSWRVSSPGDDPKDVKGRLRHWAQAVACNAKLCY